MTGFAKKALHGAKFASKRREALEGARKNRDMAQNEPQFPMPSTVYGPVPSWRFGQSLGIDLIVRDSICSFNCVYCQLGNIHQVTMAQETFVPTDRVIEDLRAVDWSNVDIVTLSGSGEPTLALNVGEVIDHIAETYDKPTLVLTNSTWLHDAATRRRLRNATIVACKLDAATEEVFRAFNRPAPGATLARSIDGIKALRDDPEFRGRIVIQSMFMPRNLGEAEALAVIINDIHPEEVQLNTPRRPYPRAWYLGSRGNHGGVSPVDTAELKTISMEDAEEVERILQEKTNVPIRSVYRK